RFYLYSWCHSSSLLPHPPPSSSTIHPSRGIPRSAEHFLRRFFSHSSQTVCTRDLRHGDNRLHRNAHPRSVPDPGWLWSTRVDWTNGIPDRCKNQRLLSAPLPRFPCSRSMTKPLVFRG